MQSKNFLPISPFLILTVVIVMGYFQVPFSFFQQDEWLGLARIVQLKQAGSGEALANIFTPSNTHYTPLTTLTIYLLYPIFNLNYQMYAVVSIAFHILTSILFFFLVRIILDNQKLAFLAALCFAVAAAGFQATAWPIADIGTHGSTLFGFLSMILLFLFIKKNQGYLFPFSILALLISLFFKENTIGFFLLHPVILVLFADFKFAKKLKYSMIIILIGVIYLSFRVLTSSNFVQSLPQENSIQTFSSFAYNIISISPRAFVQTVIPSFQLYEIAYSVGKLQLVITKKPSNLEFDEFILKTVFEFMNILLLLCVLLIGYFSFRRVNKRVKKIILFCALFVFINSLVFIFAPERSGIIYTIDSRNLYLISAGIAIFIIAAASTLKQKSLILLLVLTYLVLNLWWLNSQMFNLAKLGKTRREILSEIKKNYPTLYQQTIFYTESDSSFYGLPAKERILPFQSGFGQTLLMWYSNTEYLPKELFENRFLWEITDQGYRESSGRGYGYFRDFGLLAKTVKQNNIKLDSVLGFQYDSLLNTLEDNTEEIRGRLEGYLAKKGKISNDSFSLSSNQSSSDLVLATDYNRDTSWNSKLPYNIPMSIIVILREPKRLAQLAIDSYNNKDQDKIGYEVSLSQDQIHWNRVFYSKLFPPGDDGLDNIYFKPQTAKYIRISQIGYHCCASWVINELSIYEELE